MKQLLFEFETRCMNENSVVETVQRQVNLPFSEDDSNDGFVTFTVTKEALADMVRLGKQQGLKVKIKEN